MFFRGAVLFDTPQVEYSCMFGKGKIANKNVANNKKKITTTISGIISDSFIETNKYIPSTDTYVFNYIIEPGLPKSITLGPLV